MDFNLPRPQEANHIHVVLIHIIAEASLKANHDPIG